MQEAYGRSGYATSGIPVAEWLRPCALCTMRCSRTQRRAQPQAESDAPVGEQLCGRCGAVEDGSGDHGGRGRAGADAPGTVTGAHEEAVGSVERTDERSPVHRLWARAEAVLDQLRILDGRQELGGSPQQEGRRSGRRRARTGRKVDPSVLTPPALAMLNSDGGSPSGSASARAVAAAARLIVSTSSSSTMWRGADPSSRSWSVTPQVARIRAQAPVGSTSAGVHGPAPPGRHRRGAACRRPDGRLRRSSPRPPAGPRIRGAALRPAPPPGVPTRPSPMPGGSGSRSPAGRRPARDAGMVRRARARRG